MEGRLGSRTWLFATMLFGGMDVCLGLVQVLMVLGCTADSGSLRSGGCGRVLCGTLEW